MKNNNKMFLVTAVILALLFIVAHTTFTGPRPIDVQKYNMDITVALGKQIGFNVDNDALHFGTVPVNQGYVAIRDVMITNGEQKTTVQLLATGVMSKWVGVGQNNFTMEPKQTQLVNVTVTIPEGTTIGKYTGTFIIEFFKAE